MPLLRLWFAVCDVCAAEYHSGANRQWIAICDARGDGWHRTQSGRLICPMCWKLGRR